MFNIFPANYILVSNGFTLFLLLLFNIDDDVLLLLILLLMNDDDVLGSFRSLRVLFNNRLFLMSCALPNSDNCFGLLLLLLCVIPLL